MSTHKWIDPICIAAIVVAVAVAFLFCNSQAVGRETNGQTMGYENRLFDRTRVHTIDIVMSDWEGFIETCQNEEYSPCSIVIDGEAYKNVGIRAKGNTSLSSVASMGSSRYSFKIEFDQYDKDKSYYGLDKICLNNLIQDNTCMKDYLAYTLMADFGVASPLCSYVYITVNGEEWGLYLAVEAVEESFLRRNYGSAYGELYKPDSQNLQAGRQGGMPGGAGGPPGEMGVPEGETVPFGEMGDIPEGTGDGPEETGVPGGESGSSGDIGSIPEGEFVPPGDMSGTFGGMGSADVKLQYIDENPDSYPNIFENAKTDISQSDQKRLIAALKALSENSDIENAVDTEEVMRYFVVHNFLCNGDSYTGTMVHNYYLYEEEGRLSMIPWDYNLAFGGFGNTDAVSTVNAPIDTPVSGDLADRPMVSWIFADETYTQRYHALFEEWMAEIDLTARIEETVELISAYVRKDPTKFCTYDEYEKGIAALRDFCELRVESIRGQLAGTIPSTAEGQAADEQALLDTGALNLSDMGTMQVGGGFGGGRDTMFGDGSGEGRDTMFGGGSGGGSETMRGDEFEGGSGKMRVDGSERENETLPGESAGERLEEYFEEIGRNRPLGDFATADEEASSFGGAGGLIGISMTVLLMGLAAAYKFKR